MRFGIIGLMFVSALAFAAATVAGCDSMTMSATAPPLAAPPLCNGPPVASMRSCWDFPDTTAGYSNTFASFCYKCEDVTGHGIGYIAQPGDPSGTNDLSCWSDSSMTAICVGVCVPATQDHRGCPP